MFDSALFLEAWRQEAVKMGVGKTPLSLARRLSSQD